MLREIEASDSGSSLRLYVAIFRVYSVWRFYSFFFNSDDMCIDIRHPFGLPLKNEINGRFQYACTRAQNIS